MFDAYPELFLFPPLLSFAVGEVPLAGIAVPSSLTYPTAVYPYPSHFPCPTATLTPSTLIVTATLDPCGTGSPFRVRIPWNLNWMFVYSGAVV